MNSGVLQGTLQLKPCPTYCILVFLKKTKDLFNGRQENDSIRSLGYLYSWSAFFEVYGEITHQTIQVTSSTTEKTAVSYLTRKWELVYKDRQLISRSTSNRMKVVSSHPILLTK